jgi:GrpB-like predicted nucleotidyltransferase (UPF0157 family)
MGTPLSRADEPIHIADYQTAWPLEFVQEQSRLSAGLGISPSDLEHIGSTAVPGMAAKPIIDVMLGVRELPLNVHLEQAIGALGWECLCECGVPGRIYFRLRRERQANLHAVVKAGKLWNANLALRDYLRRSQSARERYSAVKHQAIAAGAVTLLAYSSAKADIMASLLVEAGASELP